MPLERPSNGASITEVFDHVLDKGVVIDALVQLSLVGGHLVTVESQVIVASLESPPTHADRFSELARRLPKVSDEF
jgi:hypothetical protein